MIILDTNVISALMRDMPDPSVAAWTTSVSILEIETGLQTMPPGKRRSSLSEDFERLLARINHRILAFDEPAARLAAELTGLREKKGYIVEIRDTMIAGIVLAHHAILATRNMAHFSDLSAKVVNPWAA